MGPLSLVNSKYQISKTNLGKASFTFGAFAVLLDYEELEVLIYPQ